MVGAAKNELMPVCLTERMDVTHDTRSVCRCLEMKMQRRGGRRIDSSSLAWNNSNCVLYECMSVSMLNKRGRQAKGTNTNAGDGL